MAYDGREGRRRVWAEPESAESVAERVAREAHIPVMVVRAGANGATQLFRSIAVFAGRGTFDGPARRYARGLAAEFKGEFSQESLLSLREAAVEAATLVVMAQPGVDATSRAAGAVDRALRSAPRSSTIS